jgi:hypothetical protein
MAIAISQKNTLYTCRLKLTPSNLDWVSKNNAGFLLLFLLFLLFLGT